MRRMQTVYTSPLESLRANIIGFNLSSLVAYYIGSRLCVCSECLRQAAHRINVSVMHTSLASKYEYNFSPLNLCFFSLFSRSIHIHSGTDVTHTHTHACIHTSAPINVFRVSVSHCNERKNQYSTEEKNRVS